MLERPGVIRRSILFCLFCVVLCLATASPLWAKDEAKKIVALVDYIGGDYKNAVRSREVINPGEYQEMREFSQRALELLGQLRTAEREDKASVEPSLKKLAAQIEQKEDEKGVAELTQEIRKKLTTTYNIIPYPKTLPSLKAGSAVFAQNCAQCHGVRGNGAGINKADMPVAPRKHTNTAEMARLKDSDLYDAISQGGIAVGKSTLMPPWSGIMTDTEIKEMVAYLRELCHCKGE